ncbi:MAG: SRPBCC domain-containing protein [Bacteroidota bacterium]
MNNEPFIIERTYNAPAEKVWKAITDKREMKQWYFDLVEFKAEVGFEFHFTGGPSPERQYVHLCKITEVIPGKKLTHTWRYDGYKGNSLVTFELFAEGSKTRLKLTHAGLETFPNENPDFAKHNFAEGWTDIIGRSLKEYVEK